MLSHRSACNQQDNGHADFDLPAWVLPVGADAGFNLKLFTSGRGRRQPLLHPHQAAGITRVRLIPVCLSFFACTEVQVTHICQAAMQPCAFQERQPANALPLICPQVALQLDGQLICISLYSRHIVIGECQSLCRDMLLLCCREGTSLLPYWKHRAGVHSARVLQRRAHAVGQTGPFCVWLLLQPAATVQLSARRSLGQPGITDIVCDRRQSVVVPCDALLTLLLLMSCCSRALSCCQACC